MVNKAEEALPILKVSVPYTIQIHTVVDWADVVMCGATAGKVGPFGLEFHETLNLL